MTDYTPADYMPAKPDAPAASLRSMLAVGLDRTYAFCVNFVENFFDHRHIRGVDFCLCAISAGWVWAVTKNPDVMQRLSYAKLTFLDQQALVSVFAVLSISHLVGFLKPEALSFRILALFLAGWVWIVIGGYMTWAVTTGGVTYLVAGFVAWIATVHLERQRQKG